MAFRQWRNIAVIFLVLSVLAFASILLGQVEFGGYDSSMLIDLGWRQHLGQRPYQDFPCMLPPIFYLSTRWAITLFGRHWSSFTALNSLIWFALVAMGCVLIELARETILRRRRRLLHQIFVSSMAIPLLVTNHLWHSTLSSETVVVALLVYYLILHDQRADKRVNIHLFAAAILLDAILFLCKPNVGLPFLLLIGSLGFVVSHHSKFFYLWLTTLGGGAFFASLLLLASSISPLAVFRSYLGISDRPSALDVLSDFLSESKDWSVILEATASYAIVVTLIVLVSLQYRYRSRQSVKPIAMLAGIGGAITLIGISSNWDVRLNDLAPAFFGTMIYLFDREEVYVENHHRFRAATRTLMVFTCIITLIAGVRRTRMQSVGTWAGDVYGTLSYQYDPFFGPFVGRDEFWSTLKLIDKEVAAHPNAQVYFGERLEFEYARLDLHSPTQLPVWWHKGSSYSTSDEASFTEVFRKRHFDILVFVPGAHQGYDRFPQAIMAEINRHYDRVPESQHLLDIYKRKP